MTTLTIDTLAARYHLPPSALAARERLDRAMAAAFEEALPLALARRGIDPEEGEICLREVRVPLRVRLSAGDGALMLEWSEAAAEAIAAALAAGGDGNAVRFASRRQALAEFAVAVARGDLRRAWAYAQLGLCRPEAGRSGVDAADGLARALAGEPEAIVPVLAEVARGGWLGALVEQIPAGCWTELAIRALAASGGGMSIPALAGASERDLAELGPSLLSRIPRALARSSLAAAAWAVAAIRTEPPLRAAFAALALVEADSGLLGRPEAVAVVVASAAALEVPVSGRHTDDLGRTRTSTDERADRLEPRAEEEEDGSLVIRVSGWTDWGGLLFLLALTDDLGLPERLETEGLLAQRPLRWSLHRLALALAPVAEDDPAALAFAGLPPDAPPPSVDEPPAAPEETELFAAMAGQIGTEVASRLGEPDLPGPALLDRICRRRAQIFADPGWLEVRLSLEDVATDLRRAGLDLDPGYLPHLGVVVRFVYV